MDQLLAARSLTTKFEIGFPIWRPVIGGHVWFGFGVTYVRSEWKNAKGRHPTITSLCILVIGLVLLVFNVWEYWNGVLIARLTNIKIFFLLNFCCQTKKARIYSSKTLCGALIPPAQSFARALLMKGWILCEFNFPSPNYSFVNLDDPEPSFQSSTHIKAI